MVVRGPLGVGAQVAPEEAAVVDHPGQHLDVVPGRRIEAELTRPGLERVEDDHRPVDPLTEALEAGDQVEGEAVGRPRRDADPCRQPLIAQRRHRVPDHLAGVADAVWVVEQQQVEGVGADPAEAFLGRHPQVVAVLVGAAQLRVGEAREPFRPFPLALVEVVPDRADQAVVVARDALERPPQHPVGLALPVGVGGKDRVDAVVRAQQRRQAVLGDRLPEVEETPSAPGADRGPTRLLHAEMAGSMARCAWGRDWPSRSRTQGAAFAGCKGKPEDADMRSARRVIQVCLVVGPAI